jgi:citrate synthase
MERLINESETSTTIQSLCTEYVKNNQISQEEFMTHRVKRGLRNNDGTGVMAGLTHVCNVHGYLIADGDKIPDEGKLTYRGIDVRDIINGCISENRYAFEEVVWLLISANCRIKDSITGSVIFFTRTGSSPSTSLKM